MIDVEQWKSDGNCAICRKNNYCSRDCKARKIHKQKIISQALINVLNEYKKDEKPIEEITENE